MITNVVIAQMLPERFPNEIRFLSKQLNYGVDMVQQMTYYYSKNTSYDVFLKRRDSMVISVNGEFYIYETMTEPDKEDLKEFFKNLGENDILEVRILEESGTVKKRYHLSKIMVENELEGMNLALTRNADTFQYASQICPLNLVMPVVDEDGNCVNIIKRVPTCYDHFYRYEGGMDLWLLNRYDSLILTFFFSYVIHPGMRNPDKHFLLIDGQFYITGMFAIWDRVCAAARYAIAKGYAPAFMIVSADSSMYSDFPGDDIWNKFFLQPGTYTLPEVLESSYVALSPNTFLVKNVLRRIMDEVSAGRELLWPLGFFNEQVKNYIRERKERFLPCPERTLGVLIRGTDYIHNPFPGHARQATVEQVIEKIAEEEGVWEFDRIFLSTEDADVCQRMKEVYGDRITFTDQERYRIEPGHVLVELHKEKKAGEGFRLGAEYLCTLNLLSQCNSLIASGGCCGLTETLRENEGKFKHVFVFQLGCT